MRAITKYEADDGRSKYIVQTKITNLTVVNIMENSCTQNFETVACIRSSILATLAVLTAILCVVKLVRLHLAHHPSCHLYVIFYAAGFECAIGNGRYTQ